MSVVCHVLCLNTVVQQQHNRAAAWQGSWAMQLNLLCMNGLHLTAHLRAADTETLSHLHLIAHMPLIDGSYIFLRLSTLTTNYSIEHSTPCNVLMLQGQLDHCLINYLICVCSAAALYTWGWRVPFLLSVFTVVSAALLRYNMPESSEFNESREVIAEETYRRHQQKNKVAVDGHVVIEDMEQQEAHKQQYVPVLELFRSHWRGLVLHSLYGCCECLFNYLIHIQCNESLVFSII